MARTPDVSRVVGERATIRCEHCRRDARRRRDAMKPFEVRRVDNALVRLSAARMARDPLRAVEDQNFVVSNEDLHRATDQTMRDAVANGIDIDEAVACDLALLSSLPNGNRSYR
jgi:hypothetical protein